MFNRCIGEFCPLPIALDFAIMSLFRLFSILFAFACISPIHAGLLSSIINPLLDVSGSILSGQGIIQGVLGGLEGILGADQT
jgi:choline dehydrogenase